MDTTAEERKRRLAPEHELWCWLCANWDTTFLRRTLPCTLVWTRALCQDYTAAGRKFWKHAPMSSTFGRTRLRFRKVCQLLSRTSILTHVSSSILRRFRLTALTTRYSVSDVVRLQASNFHELHHLSIHKCIATSRLVKVCTFLTTLIPPWVDQPPKNKWIFSWISSWFSVFPFCLPPLYYFSFFFKFAILMTVPQSAHWCDATEHLQLCTDLMSLFRSCKSTYFFTFFALLHCIIFDFFFQILHFRLQLSCW